MDKLTMHTPNLADENYAKLAALFPNAVTESIDPETGEVVRAIDKDVLMQEINTHVVEGREERYQFTWPDKRKAVLAANAPISAALRPVRADSVGKDGTPGGWDSENLYIEGDNLDVLKLLQETYLGKVKMIYIDPPYNTGNDFVYEDDFAEDTDSYMARSGQVDEQGNRLTQNTESNGRFHTDWLNMMYPRLRVAKDLLAEDGVIFISIDDNEVDNLKKLCNEVFGEANFVAQFVWQSRQNKDNRNITGVSVDHEYIVCYSKQFGHRIFKGTDRKVEQYKNPDNDPRGLWTSANMVGLANVDARPNLHYDLINPADGINYGCPAKGWRYDRNTMNRLIQEDRIIWPDNPEGRPRKKSFLNELSGNLPGFSSIFGNGFYTNTATKEIGALFNTYLFDFPKPSELVKQITSQVTNENDIILDFFSGSATTAHAVMQLNAEDGGHRQFIMVQLPETCDEKSEAYKAGYKNICEIGKERIRRAGRKIKEACEPKPLMSVYCFDPNDPNYGKKQSEVTSEGKPCPDIGFRVLRLDSSNMQDVYYNPAALTQSMLDMTTDNIKPDRTPEDLLFQVMLELGVLPSSEIAETTIDGHKVFDVADGFLLACFDAGVTTETVTAIAKRQPYYAVFRDSSLQSDSVAANFEQIFEAYSPSTVRKVL